MYNGGGGAEVVFSVSGMRGNAKIVIKGLNKPSEALVDAKRQNYPLKG